MEKIKFRIWDKRFKKWVKKRGSLRAIYYCLEHPNFVAYIFMQFTGLTDKNEKDIYEGDIVTESVNSYRWVSEIRRRPGSGMNLFKVTRYRNFNIDENNNRIFGDFWVNNIYSELYDSSSIEVIGNIYENPELISKDVQDSIASV